ncbi:amidohydrolase family protein [Mycobacteroides abscessus]|uniref:amidohydrolase family protein n=1 Tax=Mycobacteroides abscessus TaxID=36809 RepID=UPI000927BC98|nr:amidohydrolase family protein [Mycobacteroides abscessus]MCU8694065.1 amidohydrolase family protein [Mycobacteroides abscessus]MCU8713273.1 amidohydrolase family protein [Mycobacteroides abscessus]MCU8718018.1 amidohydrolase family protein [Mycobacteroides abscessus]MCU8752174.1 amidohydrolase family protein [Mycobacteroides abscessus]MCU8761636.1 amidohydrolase family protein [Mycobacteroides abscessus]
MTGHSTTAVVNARIFTAAGLTEPRTVLIRGRHIVESGTPTTQFDAEGNTLLPGLIDAHLHAFRGAADLEDLTDCGITTGLDMGLWPVENISALRNAHGVTDIRSATIPAVGPESQAARQKGFPRKGIVSTAQQGRAFVHQRIGEGADYVKIIAEATSPAGISHEAAAAIVDESHKHDKQVVAHAVTVGAFHLALRAGVDFITHTPLDGILDEQSVAAMARDNITCIPTLAMMHHMARLPATDAGALTARAYMHAQRTVAAMHAAGVRILVGTDAHWGSDSPADLRPGPSIYREMALLGRAGLTLTDVLCGATNLSAQAFRLEDRGSVAAAKRADLMMVSGDPTEDATAIRNVLAVWIAGQRVR